MTSFEKKLDHWQEIHKKHSVTCYWLVVYREWWKRTNYKSIHSVYFTLVLHQLISWGTEVIVCYVIIQFCCSWNHVKNVRNKWTIYWKHLMLFLSFKRDLKSNLNLKKVLPCSDLVISKITRFQETSCSCKWLRSSSEHFIHLLALIFHFKALRMMVYVLIAGLWLFNILQSTLVEYTSH